jgi:hypothetical protein
MVPPKVKEKFELNMPFKSISVTSSIGDFVFGIYDPKIITYTTRSSVAATARLLHRRLDFSASFLAFACHRRSVARND